MLGNCYKCGENKEIKADKQKEVAICQSCGAEQINLSKFMIRSMISNGDVITGAVGEKTPFGFPCQKCASNQEMVYDKESGNAKCATCGTVANMSKHMVHALKMMGHTKRSSETEVTQGRE